MAAADRPSVLFVCTHNSARSQLAEGLLRARWGNRYQAFSAGTVARGVHPGAVAALAEVGIDAAGQRSKTIDELGGRPFDVVVTVCDNAREACPYLPAQERNLHHAFRDPSAAPPAEHAASFRAARDEIAVWLDAEFGGLGTPTVDEWPAVLALVRAAHLPTRDLTPADRPRFVVARREGAVVGAVAVEPYGDAGLLRSLVVAPAARGTGLGGALVAAAETAARRAGLDTLILLTTTAAPFFEARGFVPMDREEAPPAVRASAEFAGLCPASAVCLGKPLAPEATRAPAAASGR